jgi:L-iditol 2-dehydrogenase
MGENVTVHGNPPDFKIGDRVFVHHHVPCYTCYYCRHGSQTECQEFSKTHLDPSGFAEYFRVSRFKVERGSILKIPNNMSFEEATIIETMATCIRGLNRVKAANGLHIGDTALVVGAGPVGLIMVSLLKIYGAGQIIVVEPLEFRANAAKKFGADHVFNPFTIDVLKEVNELTDGRGPDLVIEAAGSTKTIEQSLEYVRKGGTFLMFGVPPIGEKISIEPMRLNIHEINIITSHSSCEVETNMALSLLANKKINGEAFITHKFKLMNIEEALRFAADSKRNSIKVVVTD